MAGSVLNCQKSFNNSGLLFTHIEENGKIKIWDTSTGVLKQEFIKNFHLNSSCTSLVWLQTSKVSGHKRKKLKASDHYVGDSCELIALGTTLGNIILYEVSSNSVSSELEGHTGKVNYLTWSSENNSLFSCSEDKYIIEWDIVQQKFKSKWKIDENVQCILALSNGKNLLSANCSIKLWDWEKKQVVKIFTGHSTEVTSLVEVPNRDGYFVSAAKGDRVLSVWSLNSKEKKVNQVASLILQDPASSIQMINFGTDMSTVLYAVTEGGVLQIFKHKFNGTLNRPLKPVTNVSIASENIDSKNSHPIAIQAVLPLQSDKITIAFGTLPFLNFEIITLEKNQENIVIVRQERRKILSEEFNSKTKVPIIPNDVEYQTPGLTHLKRRNQEQLEVPLEERLENLALVYPQSSETLKKDNMAQLLLQGLQSKDRKILENVLFRAEQPVIEATVKNLPVQALKPLIRELTSLMQGKTFTSKCAVAWLNSVVRRHSGILLSNPELTDMFEPLLASIEARVAVLPLLLRLKGRLALVTEQIRNNLDDNSDNVAEPLFTYQEQESSDEGELGKMSGGSGSESEDNWSEYSEMEDDKEEEMDDK